MMLSMGIALHVFGLQRKGGAHGRSQWEAWCPVTRPLHLSGRVSSAARGVGSGASASAFGWIPVPGTLWHLRRRGSRDLGSRQGRSGASLHRLRQLLETRIHRGAEDDGVCLSPSRRSSCPSGSRYIWRLPDAGAFSDRALFMPKISLAHNQTSYQNMLR